MPVRSGDDSAAVLRRWPTLDPALVDAVNHCIDCDLANLAETRVLDQAATLQARPEDLRDLDVRRVEVKDVSIPRSQDRLLEARLYLPTARPPAGAILYLHGGAFCMGDLDTAHLRCMYYAQASNALVLNIDYALAPEHPYPAGVDDCMAALTWLSQYVAERDYGASKVIVAGESAGGGLAAAVALRARDEGRTNIAAQMLLCPALDHRQGSASIRDGFAWPGWNSVENARMWSLYLAGRPADAYASPAVAEELRGLPPALVQTAELDPLRDEGIEYALRLLTGGVPTDLHHFTGTFHVFDFAAPDSQVSQVALAEQVRFLTRHLSGPAESA